MQLVNKNALERPTKRLVVGCTLLFVAMFFLGRFIIYQFNSTDSHKPENSALESVAKNPTVGSGSSNSVIDYSKIAAQKLFFHAYLGNQTKDGLVLHLSNFFDQNIVIESISIDGELFSLEKPIELSALPSEEIHQYRSYEVPFSDDIARENISSMALLFKTSLEPNELKKMPVELFNMNIDIAEIPDFINLADIEKISDLNFMDVDGDQITIVGGEWNITETLVIPPNFTVIAREGVTLNLSNNVSFISLSPVDFRGIEGSPVTIVGGGVNSGVAILQAEERSTLSHAVFKNCSGPKYGVWNLTGAVVFYESAVDISNTAFFDNESEDSLNIIRTNFTFTDSLISGTLSDAFDGDFVIGTVTNSQFKDCGNDCLDFSGADITVTNTKISKAGDKGVSIGEQSQARLSNIVIANANIGIASKDASRILADKIEIFDSNIGLAAYQKKPEYAGGNIDINQSDVQNTQTVYMIETGSTLTGDFVAKQVISYDNDVAITVELP